MSSKQENAHRKILAVDDDPQSLRVLQKALEWDGYQVAVAASGREAIHKMTEWGPHLVLLDVNMPDLDGLQTMEFLRKSTEYVSTIFVSGQSGQEDIIRGLDLGADDYICKPYNPAELLARIRCHLRIKDIRDELRRANGKLRELVDHDDLTGLFNMRSLYQKLDHELDRAQRYKRQVAAIMMDLDHFKLVNDENDHLFGSFVLSEVGRLIRENVRKVDFAARYGGDEFIVVLTEINREGALIFGERLRKTIGDHLFKNEFYQRRLTVSLGMCLSAAEGVKVDARTLVRMADKALYNSKQNGRNRIDFFDFSSEAGPHIVPEEYFRKR